MRRHTIERRSVFGRITAVLVVVAATAGAGGSVAGPAAAVSTPGSAFVPGSLLAEAQAKPDSAFKIIIQGSPGGSASVAAAVHSEAIADPGNALGLKRQLATIEGAAAEVTGKQLVRLAHMPGITAITPDALVQLTGGLSNQQQWPFVTGVARGWSNVTNGSLPRVPAIAIVDSGVDESRADFGGRVVKQVTLTSLPGNSAGDGRGHGTFVAGIAAGSAQGYTGAAPSAKIVSLDVMDDQGMALTSDVIAAADWIWQNKGAYDIRVANFSLHSTAPASVFWDPLDRAVEKLCFSGVTVVTASGNYAVDGQPSSVLYAPGNDPFVITVGANDINGSVSTNDDTAAPWSTYGYTLDGFAKPELAAPGRYMIGPIPPTSTLALDRPGSMTAPGYIQLSGTSFAAPAGGPTPVFDAASWGSAAQTDASWGSASWGSASWGSASWGSASWGSASWGSLAWSSASWGTASWGSASWGSAPYGEIGAPPLLDAVQAAEAEAELGITVNADGTVGAPDPLPIQP